MDAIPTLEKLTEHEDKQIAERRGGGVALRLWDRSALGRTPARERSPPEASRARIPGVGNS